MSLQNYVKTILQFLPEENSIKKIVLQYLGFVQKFDSIREKINYDNPQLGNQQITKIFG